MTKDRCLFRTLFFILAALALAVGREARSDTLIDTLQKKGVLTEDEAAAAKTEQEKNQSVLAPQEARALEEEQERRGAAAEAKFVLLKGLEGLKIGALGYFDYSYGRLPMTKQYVSVFSLTRGYINIEKEITSWLSARVTPDIVLRTKNVSVKWMDPTTGQTVEATGADPQSGDMELRLKYYYAQFNIPDLWIFSNTKSEVGMGHMAWLDFEEKINPYRCQGTMFQERAGLFNSADLGINVQGYLGGEMSDTYKKTVSKSYAGRYGSYHIGLVNGSGYNAAEANIGKVVQYRLTLRPVPDVLPGLQLTYFGLTGAGNQPNNAAPTWNDNTAFVSYQHEYFTTSFEFVRSHGNQKGTLVDAKTKQSLDAGGWSLFGFLRFPLWKPLRVFGRYDAWDPNLARSDDSYQLAMAGASYDVTGDNLVMVDYERLTTDSHFDKSNYPNPAYDWRVQAVYQLSF